MSVVRVRFECWLAPGRYFLTASVNRSGQGFDSHDTREDVTSLIVHAGLPGGGLVDLPHSVEIQRA